MTAHVPLGRVAGVQIGLHYSWFLIAGLLTLSLAKHLYAVNPGWSALLVWSAAVLTAVAFFVALIVHEMSHAAVARSRGVPVPRITLFALGGVAQMGRDVADPKTEFWMGLAGPFASAAIGLAALGVARALGWTLDATPGTPALVMLVWFGWINLVLAAFNMIPGFPLDGGRVLRAIVWWVTGNRVRATRIAAAAGQIVAFGLLALGLLSFFRGAGVGGLWLAFIGFFLSQAAGAAAAAMAVSESLKGVRVGDVMSRDCTLVDRSTPLADLVQQLLRTGRRCFFVAEDGHVAGMLTPAEMRDIDRERWPSTPAGEVMRPVDRLHRIEPEATVTNALEVIAREDVNQLPVMEGRRLLGVISRDQIVRLLSARAELTSM